MNRKTKGWLMMAAILVIVGLIVLAVVLSAANWDISQLDMEAYETHTHVIGEAFSHIAINTKTADIIFSVSADDTCSVVCYEKKNAAHIVEVQQGTLTIRADQKKNWYEYIEIGFHQPSVTVFLPQAAYASLKIQESTGAIQIPGEFTFDEADIALSTGDVNFAASVRGLAKIQTSTGDIRVVNTSVGNLELTSVTGLVKVSRVNCGSLLSNGSTGDAVLENVIAAEKISVTRSTGDVRLDNSDAEEIYVKTSTGSVSGALLSEKIFLVKTSTGKISVPDTITGGKCEIITTTGDIHFTNGSLMNEAQRPL